MVTITNGVKTFRVTAGAVKPYKSMGFRVVSDKELEEMRHVEQVHFDDSGESDFVHEEKNVDDGDGQGDGEHVGENEDAFIEELLEKPLSQWSNDEVKEFVRIKDIDTDGAKKVSQVRDIIKVYLEEEQKNNA
ncbi:MAG: hypothetical protein K2N34_05615 [Lachnospiraceae bacterium]|nr:hypothetical protein [Lachnospiraceae bacterium]